MGEQTHVQIETLPKPESQSQPLLETPKTQQDSEPQSSLDKSAPSSDSNARISHPQPASLSEASHATATEISHNPQNPSKIPIRPQKIRKLSTPTPDKPSTPQTTADDSSVSASSSLALTTTTASTTTAMTPVTPTTTHSAKNRRRSASQASRVLPQVIKPLSADGEIELAIRHLRAADPLLSPLIDTHPPPQFEFHHNPFHALTKSILYQQLAYKAGTSIYTRFVSLCGGEESISPDSVLALSPQQLKQLGFLAARPAICSWSVHMFMIFSLHRPDVLPVSDLGVRKGVQLLNGLEELPRPSQMEQLCEKWKPYRSVGAWYMWRFVEGKGAPTSNSGGVLDGSVVQPLQQIEPQQDGHQHQHQHQLQFVEPVNGIGNIG
ncbi:UNVERIFIED_CONTAM: hypothetical protein Scaly_2157200 [Sesamum calycinum]|uniref:HhH-GPD domain-containing protein n=1 Tax=Sesamum calycinum TaxID=2727403 RepID=A0AAW2MMI9_9LAMI